MQPRRVTPATSHSPALGTQSASLFTLPHGCARYAEEVGHAKAIPATGCSRDALASYDGEARQSNAPAIPSKPLPLVPERKQTAGSLHRTGYAGGMFAEPEKVDPTPTSAKVRRECDGIGPIPPMNQPCVAVYPREI